MIQIVTKFKKFVKFCEIFDLHLLTPAVWKGLIQDQYKYVDATVEYSTQCWSRYQSYINIIDDAAYSVLDLLQVYHHVDGLYWVQQFPPSIFTKHNNGCFEHCGIPIPLENKPQLASIPLWFSSKHTFKEFQNTHLKNSNTCLLKINHN